jgi:hypothetical protein
MMMACTSNPRSSTERTCGPVLHPAINCLALNMEKCMFAGAELDFLGHRISAARVAPLQDNFLVINQVYYRKYGAACHAVIERMHVGQGVPVRYCAHVEAAV